MLLLAYSSLNEGANNDSLCLMAAQPEAGLVVWVWGCVTLLLRAKCPGGGCSEWTPGSVSPFLGSVPVPGAVSPFLDCVRLGRTWCKACGEEGVRGVQEELVACGEEVWGFDHKLPVQLRV